MKIIVDTPEEKQDLLAASKYLHWLREVDTDIPMVNTICHLYLTPELIEVKNQEF